METLSLIGFGTQASAWAPCLQDSGWSVCIYLHRKEGRFQAARALGFETFLVDELPSHLTAQGTTPQWLALLCPDASIGPLYDQYLAPLNQDLRLILAHGFAIYSHQLRIQNPRHAVCLLAPKAIGPKILEQFRMHFPSPHTLRAASCSTALTTDLERKQFLHIARALGFAPQSLIPVSFEQETIGDLISEQGLLCGGLFNLLIWTLEAMQKAGIPHELIHEECITELELIAGILKTHGPAGTFKKISEVAQCGTIAMGDRLRHSTFKTEFDAQMKSIQSGEFSAYYQSKQWLSQTHPFETLLNAWEIKLTTQPLLEESAS
jgi:ketol-acid reductoisomerase